MVGGEARPVGKVRPALAAALSLAAFLLLRDIEAFRQSAPAIAYALSSLFATAATMLRIGIVPSPPRRAMALRLFGVALGFALAAGSAAALDAREALSTGFPPERVREIRARTLADSARSKGGTLYAQALLVRTGDGTGAWADASGEILVFPEGELRSGTMFKALTGLTKLDTGGFSARTGEIELIGSTASGAARSTLVDALAGSLSCFGQRDPALGNLMEALLYGRRGDLDREDAALFAESGCAHVLALSGMHLVVIASFARFLLGFVLGKRGALALTLLLVIAYTWIADFQPALLRSAAMFLVAIPFSLRGRKADSLSLLAASFILVVLLDPPSFYGLSLRFSFVAVLGMIALGPRFSLFLEKKLPPALAAPLAAGLAAQCSAAFIQALAFGSLSPLGFAATLLVSPLVSALIILGFASSILFLSLPSLSASLGEAVSWVAMVLRDLLYRCLDLFRFQLELDSPPAYALCFALLVLILLLMYSAVHIDGWNRVRFARKDLRLP